MQQKIRLSIKLHKPPPHSAPFRVLCPFYILENLSMELLHCFWNNFSWISSISVYYHVINRSKIIKWYEFCVEVLYSECREIATNCLKKISSNQKYLTSQNHFKLENSYTFPKVILHECQGQCKLEYLYGRFVYNMPQNAVYCIDCAMLWSAEKPRSARDKRVAIIFQENQR